MLEKIFFLVHGAKSEEGLGLSEAGQADICKLAELIEIDTKGGGKIEIWSDSSLVSEQTAEIFSTRLKSEIKTQDFLSFGESGYSFPKIKEATEKIEAQTLLIVAPRFCIHFLPMQWGFNQNNYVEGGGFGILLSKTKRILF